MYGGFCAAVTEQLWTHVASEKGLCWQERLTCFIPTLCAFANPKKRRVFDFHGRTMKFPLIKLDQCWYIGKRHAILFLKVPYHARVAFHEDLNGTKQDI